MIVFGIILSLLSYILGKQIQKWTRISLLNPLLVAIVLCILTLCIFDIPFSVFNRGGSVINRFLPPATAALALSIYRQRTLLKKNLLPIFVGCLVGAISSIGSVMILSKCFGLNDVLMNTLIPKSVTTPIAMEISKTLGGIPAITVAAVVITGIFGNMICPILIKLFRIKDSSAAGIAIGACSHAVGTSKALELGEIEGAMSGIAIGISGVITILIALFL